MLHHEYTIPFPALGAFSARMYRSSDIYVAHEEPHHSYADEDCEIYVNLSGNVAFMVEKNVYPIRRGDIIITRPFEYHHCIYLDDGEHDHYCIWIPHKGNDALLRPFFDRPPGEGNLISLPDADREAFLDLCARTEALADQPGSLEMLANLMMMLAILAKPLPKQSPETAVQSPLPDKLREILDYLSDNFTQISTVSALADRFYISRNTLERLFRHNLGITPNAYITHKRLAHARLLLIQDKTVTEACYESGFNDQSYFIAKFHREFGMTPLQYKHQFRKE